MSYEYADWLNNIAESADQVYKMVTGGAYVVGCVFLIKAFYSLKVYGEARTMMSNNTSIKEPLTYLLVGASLVYLPSAFDVLMNTSFGSDTVLSYSELPDDLDFTYENGGLALLRVMQVVGVVSFVRGWVLVSRAQGQGSQPGTLGKGITHIFSGIFMMNIVATIDVVYNTLGID